MRNPIAKLGIIATIISVFSTVSVAEYSGDEAQRYAQILVSDFRSGGVCDTFASQINRIADSAAPANVRIMQIDRILESADKYSCVRY